MLPLFPLQGSEEDEAPLSPRQAAMLLSVGDQLKSVEEGAGNRWDADLQAWGPAQKPSQFTFV